MFCGHGACDQTNIDKYVRLRHHPTFDNSLNYTARNDDHDTLVADKCTNSEVSCSATRTPLSSPTRRITLDHQISVQLSHIILQHGYHVVSIVASLRGPNRPAYLFQPAGFIRSAQANLPQKRNKNWLIAASPSQCSLEFSSSDSPGRPARQCPPRCVLPGRSHSIRHTLVSVLITAFPG